MTHSRETFWPSNVVSGLSFLRATFYNQRFSRHTHDHFVVCVNVEGAHRSWYRGGTITVPAGKIGIVNPNEVHTGESVAGTAWRYRAFYPSAELFQAIAADRAGRPAPAPAFRSPPIDDPELAVRLLRAHLRCEREVNPLDIEVEVTTVLTLLLARHANGEHPEPRIGQERVVVQRVREYLDAHLADRPRLDDLAALAEFSRFYLLRVFRAEAGLAPHQYLTQIRVERAKQLLAAGWPISQVATAVGLSDQSHLNRRFKRLVGITPGQYAASVRN
ncbi:MAG: AraC family transcriptional regulator [Gemmatimonadales bacterium]